jgi:triacylglycerol lipase
MRDDTAAAIAKIDRDISPEMIAASQGLYQSQHEREPYAGITVTRDHKYGPLSRNRLDVFAPTAGGEKRPVLIFVHGGGFVGGDKVSPGTAYYDNVGVWAVRNGFVGVTMTYPLAPEGVYPTGARSVGEAVGWVLKHIGKYSGDPYNVVLLGQSAGATHVATYGARPELHASPGGGVRAIALLSGIYEFVEGKLAPNALAYLGTAPDAAAKGSALPGIAMAGIPLMFGISELDPAPFHISAKKLTDALFAQTGKMPNVLFLPRHNHITQIAHLNAADTGDTLLADRLREFINVHTARELTAH